MKLCLECGLLHDARIAQLTAENEALLLRINKVHDYAAALSRMLFALNREISIPHPEVHYHHVLSTNTSKRMQRYRQALLKISKGEQEFSPIQYAHTYNALDAMKHVALNALEHLTDEEAS